MTAEEKLPRENLDSLCQTALHHFGVPSQLNKAIQECGELLVAISQFNEHRDGSEASVIEETADVLIMATQLAHVFGRDKVDQMIQKKLRRLKDRIRTERADEGQKTSTIGDPRHDVQGG